MNQTYEFSPTVPRHEITLAYAHLSMRVQEGNARGDGLPLPGVCYPGYVLPLSHLETRMLKLLLLAVEGPATGYGDKDGYIPSLALGEAGRLRTAIGVFGSHIPADQVAVHVMRINRKAKIIGGRRLILSHKGRGYRLNPYM